MKRISLAADNILPLEPPLGFEEWKEVHSAGGSLAGERGGVGGGGGVGGVGGGVERGGVLGSSLPIIKTNVWGLPGEFFLNIFFSITFHCRYLLDLDLAE